MSWTARSRKSHAHRRPRRGRPPRPPEEAEARQRLIRAGLIHLTEKGYTATGLDEILREARVPKGSFYHYFDGKPAFGAALIEAYHQYFAARLDRFLTDDPCPPRPHRRLHRRRRRGMARHGFRRGCLVGNLGQEMGALPEDFRARLSAVLQDWQARTATCLRAAQTTGAPSQDPDQLAAFFWIGWEGAVLRAKLDRSAAPLHTFAQGFLALLTP
ncbi:MAG: TetR family transcriptional regulator C-terminal domain-containing protein [Exiguobacterium profundum]|nr:MAG: TetR family transcriptional regulator C-terminal domain-containing protein [Exiguobacterium profundum]